MACWLPFGLLFSLLVMLRAPVDGGCCISSVNFLFWLMFYGGWKALRWGYTVPPPTAVERGPWCLGWQILPVSQCEGLLVDNVLDATMTGSFQSNFGHFQPWMPCWIIVHMPLHHPYISPCVHFVPFSWADWEKKKKESSESREQYFHMTEKVSSHAVNRSSWSSRSILVVDFYRIWGSACSQRHENGALGTRACSKIKTCRTWYNYSEVFQPPRQ